MVLSALFSRISPYFLNGIKPFQKQETQFKGDHSTKFHFKVRKPHFKRGLERNVKNKKVLEFNIDKDGGMIFFMFFWLIIRIILFSKKTCTLVILE